MSARTPYRSESVYSPNLPETPASMQQLAPSPIPSPSPAVEKQNGPSRDTWGDASTDYMSSKGASTSTAGLSGRGAIYYLAKIQRYSSYAMAVFTSLHMANVSLIPAFTRSVPGSETYLLMTREIYQTSVTEPLLVALPLIAHVGSGMALRLIRRSQNMKRYGGREVSRAARKGANASSPWPQFSWIALSGYAFGAFYAAHVTMNRVVPFLLDGGSSNVGLAYVAHGFARHPVVASLFFSGLLALGSAHMVWGTAKWLGVAPSTNGWLGDQALIDKATRRQRRRKWLGVQGLVMCVTALWAVGGLGVVARGGPTSGWLGKLYDDLFGAVWM